MQPTTSLNAQIQCVEHSDGSLGLKSSGRWMVDALDDAVVVLDQCLTKQYAASIQWDVSGVHHYDSAGMLLFIYYYDVLKSHNCSVDVIGVTEKHKQMYQLLRRYKSDKPRVPIDSSFYLLKLLADIGKKAVFYFQDFSAFLYFVGESFVSLLYATRHPGSIRFAAIVKNIEDAGVRALPIVALTSFLIGIVIAYQGAVQLQKFGANIFIVDMIGLSVTRELAPLITAIVVAGRTGSSYTAQLGVMKITEEIDAMRTMGFDPHRFLVLPRLFALMLTLPLLIFFADIVGILGGMFISNIHLHLSYSEFLHRLQSVLEAKHVWIGIIKGPFFAWLIAVVSCFRGFQVSNNTDSIGRYTTVSVVNAIFLVIACDAIFSVILTELGI
ncbi:ABC transporter permease [Neptunomonas antarctica]|uniref:Phospholipid/cholesterol/gamma-HCH transport system permease protein n=1 Tax=Neptunomonas antarctica TaxID=619304 RepID=A0A1N7P535_9GAMM|nr:MlaE family lipid ABC transporter permease subunit [Neptunomonas antarctica]SIT05713.1 phospholipid/cholesterol/gamma-HCH transport system permease protein [Neptunomonas antarctica]